MGLRLILLLVKLCIVFIPLRVYGSAVYNISPLAANYSAHPPTEEREHGLGYQGKPPKTGTPRPSPLHYGSVLHPPMVSAPHDSAPVSPRAEGLLPSMPPSPPTVLPPHELTPLPKPVQGPTPSIPRRSPRRSRPDVPVASPPGKLPWKSPSFKPTTPGTTPSSLPGASRNIKPSMSNSFEEHLFWNKSIAPLFRLKHISSPVTCGPEHHTSDLF